MNKIQELISNVGLNGKEKGFIYYDDMGGENFLSYSDQYKEAVKLLGILQNDYHLEKGSKLIVLFKDKRLTISAIWACILGGIVSVPLETNGTPGQMERLINVWRELGCCNIICADYELDELKTCIDEMTCDKEELLSKWIELNGSSIESADGNNFKLETSEELFIVFSSGSTGAPKGVILEDTAVYEGLASARRAMDFIDDEVLANWLPLSHVFGLVGLHLIGVMGNYTQVVFSKELFAHRPLVMLDIITKYKVTYTGLPNFAFQSILNEIKEQEYSWDLSSLRCIINSAEPTNYDMCMEFAKKLEPYNFDARAICPTFGMSEVPNGIAASKPGELMERVESDGTYIMPVQADHQNNHPVSCVIGENLDSCAIRIVADDGTPVEEKTIGHIELSGKGVFRSYYDKKQNEEAFTEDGWFRTGDMGAFIDNKLVIVGRKKEVIIINGKKIYPTDIEEYLNTSLGIDPKDAAVCGVIDVNDPASEQICVCIRNSDSIETFYLLAKQVREKLIEYGIPKRCEVIPVAQIMRTGSGKKRRSEYKKQYESGQFDSILEQLKAIENASMSSAGREQVITGVEIELLNIWKQILEIEECSINDNFFEMGGNSINVLKMILEAKSKKIIIKASDVYLYPTIAQLSKIADTSEFEGNAIVADFSFAKKINYKVIDTVVSNNDTFSWDELSCFWRAAKIAVRSYGPYYDEAFLMNLLFYQIYQVNGYFRSPYWRNRDEEYERFFNSVVGEQLKLNVSVNNDINSKEELLEHIVRSIDAGHPLVITGDLFTVFYANNYREIPHFHYFVIKGYDKEKEIVYILDNIQLDNGSSTIYKDFMMKLDDLYETMMYVKSNMIEETRQSLVWEYSKNAVGMLNPAKILLEHAKLLNDIETGVKDIYYIESEVLHLSQGEEVAPIDLQYFTIVMNEKRAYFKLVTSLMRECLLSEKEIKEIEYIQDKIVDLWNPVRNSILDSMFGSKVDMDVVREQISTASEYEKKHREKVLSVLRTLKEESVLNGQSDFENYLIMNELTVTNPLNAKMEYSENSIQINLDENERYDFWIQGKNAPRIMREVQADEWTFSAKVKNLNKFQDNRFHDGILVQFENGYSMLFGLYCENHNQMNISIYCPEAGDDCRLFTSKNCQKNHEKLRVYGNGNLLCFQRYNKEMKLWETLYELKAEQKVSKVGIFAKSWIKANHSVVFSDIQYQ